MTYAWESTALDLLTGLKLTVTELGSGLESAGHVAELTSLSRWLQSRVADGCLVVAEHPPRFSINKIREAV